MGDVVNLRLARKAKARSAKQTQAAENRIRFGRTKAERALIEAEKHSSEVRLDGHKLTPDPGSK